MEFDLSRGLFYAQMLYFNFLIRGDIYQTLSMAYGLRGPLDQIFYKITSSKNLSLGWVNFMQKCQIPEFLDPPSFTGIWAPPPPISDCNPKFKNPDLDCFWACWKVSK